MNHYNSLQIVIYLLFLGLSCYSQPDSITETSDTITFDYFDVFQKADPNVPEPPLVLHIEMDMKKFYKIKYKDESIRANLSVFLEDSLLYNKSIKVKPRGENRKTVCIFPPIEINFKKSDTSQFFSQETDKIKLVTHCKNSSLYEQYVLKEYLCYKIYNLFTDYSFRVRLLEIHYIDTEGKKKTLIKYGFVIEANKSLANRIDAYRVKVLRINLNQTDYEMANIMVLYMYMIGNTDWNVSNLHNIKLYKLKDISKFEPVPIPYDFDHAGMVNADYATPDERLDIKSVRERVYRGYCIPEEDLIANIELFRQKKDSIYALVNKFGLLNRYNKTETLNYLDEFYDIIENPNLIRREIMNKCKQE